MVIEERVRLDERETAALAAELDGREPQEVLRWGIERFGNRLAICTSLQADGMAILDMARRINPTVRVFTIDTGRMPAETYELMDQVRDRYGIALEVYYPDATELEDFVRREGVNAFYRSVPLRLGCCEIRKVNPLNKVLASLDAWVTGLRRDQSSTRAAVRAVEIDHDHGSLVKLNPLAGWTEAQVWEYIRANDVPTSALYEQGYTSIGCAPCTRPTTAGEDPRAGRWWWEFDAPKECGIHFSVETGRMERGSEVVK
ncbi:MAG: phosphoadenylyl-sulfate reductase [Dehalococcoidia bacterium]